MFLKALFPGIVGSILFWFLDNALLKLGGSARWWGMAAALAIGTALSLLVLRRREAARRSVASRRRIGGDSDDQIGEVHVAGEGDVDVLSDNRIAGNSTMTVDRIDIR